MLTDVATAMATSAQWPLWTTTAQVSVVDAGELDAVVALATRALGEVELACSRYREDSETARIRPLQSDWTPISPMLARLLGEALDAARWTEGLVDPTLGDRLEEWGFRGSSRSLGASRSQGSSRPRAGTRLLLAHRASWRDVVVEDGWLTAPAGVTFDLGSTGKASAADLIAERLLESAAVQHGVLISLGGDIATVGTGPDSGWQIDVQDSPEDPAQQVRLADGGALATSSTVHRRLPHGDDEIHHILDPRSGGPASSYWRTASCAAPRCLDANAASTAAIVLGESAPDWLQRHNVPARLVDADRRVVTIGDWPAPEMVHCG